MGRDTACAWRGPRLGEAWPPSRRETEGQSPAVSDCGFPPPPGLLFCRKCRGRRAREKVVPNGCPSASGQDVDQTRGPAQAQGTRNACVSMGVGKPDVLPGISPEVGSARTARGKAGGSG